jgi:signal transduction histidine kinase
LNAILGFGQLLELDMDGEASEEHQSHVRHILESGGHLLQLINQVLELSQIEAGKISLSLETFDPERVLEECKDMVQERARENQIALTINTGGKLPFITTDKLRFRQIILNLLSNGVKYNRTGGSVTINCERKAGPRLRFNIIDTGFGIPKDKQDALFEPFNRLGRESGEIDGTGIGLTITAHLMEILDGDFGFESEEDKGSTFWAEFSLDAPAPTAEAVDAGRASAD